MVSSPFAPGGATKTLASAELEAGFPTLAQAGFDVLAAAGSGGMGVVYRALHRETGRAVALKLVSSAEGNYERFALECDILSGLEHPGIVRHVTHGVTDKGQPYLAMEWLDGETLSQRLVRGPLSVADSVALGVQVSEALAAAHAKEVVHRDLKPSNIFLLEGKATQAKILDFGVARLREGHRDLTLTNQIVGTPGYMAPEQARGVRDIDARADLFSLGCVLFHALTGAAPFEGSDVLTVLAKLANEEPPPIGELQDDVPESLELLIVSLLSKDPAARPVSASVVSQELSRIAETVAQSPEFRRLRGASARKAQLECIILARRPNSPGEADGTPFTEANISALQREIFEVGGLLQVLGGNALLVRVTGQGTAADRAEAAARCADLISRSRPEWLVSIASRLSGSPADASGHRDHGAIDSATRTLVGAPPGKVRLARPDGASETRFQEHVLRAIEAMGTPFELAPTVAGPLTPRESDQGQQSNGAQRDPSSGTLLRLLLGILLVAALAIGVFWFTRASEVPSSEPQKVTEAAAGVSGGANDRTSPSVSAPQPATAPTSEQPVAAPSIPSSPEATASSRAISSPTPLPTSRPSPTAAPSANMPTALPAREAWE